MTTIEQIDQIFKVNDEEILGFFKEYRFLSNYHNCPVVFEGILYPSSEAAYQAAKLTDPQKRRQFTTMTPPMARKEGMTMSIRPDWKEKIDLATSPAIFIEEVRDKVMYDICTDKFTRNQDLGKRLLETGERYLEETNYWGDKYWGVHEKQGYNKLGKILMRVRFELATNK